MRKYATTYARYTKHIFSIPDRHFLQICLKTMHWSADHGRTVTIRAASATIASVNLRQIVVFTRIADVFLFVLRFASRSLAFLAVAWLQPNIRKFSIRSLTIQYHQK